jgi:hypothetical protein
VLSVLLTMFLGGCVVYFWPCLLVDVLSALLKLSFGGCVVSTFDPVFWWMCCLYFWPCLLVDVFFCTFDLVFWWICCLYCCPCLLVDVYMFFQQSRDLHCLGRINSVLTGGSWSKNC